MDVDRRAGSARIRRWLVCLVIFGSTLGGLARAAPEARYPLWEQYQQRFVTAAGRVVDTGNGGISHTEGQGSGMLFALFYDDPATFRRIWDWTRTHLGQGKDQLFAWRYNPSADPPVQDTNDASDGDILIAWALDRAGRQWNRPAYTRDAERLLRLIRSRLVLRYGGYTVLLPGQRGFQHDGYVVLNLSYLVVPALRRFAIMDPKGPWKALIRDGQTLLDRARFGAAGLPVDWLRLGRQGGLSPAPGQAPRFGFDAIRIPLYFTWGGVSGSPGLAAIADYWARDPSPPAWVDVLSGETASYPLSRGGMAVRDLLLGRYAAVPADITSADRYYSASLILLTRMAMAADGPLYSYHPGH